MTAGGRGVLPSLPTPLVGRDEEASRLRHLLGIQPAPPEARAPRIGDAGRPVLVVGEAGIGKTALWRCAVADATGSGWTVLTAEPTEAETALTYAGLGDLVDAVLDDIAARDPDVLDRLGQPKRSALAVALLRAPARGAAPDARAVGLAVASLLDLLSASGDVLVAVDDVQWLDASSAAALGYALRRVRSPRVHVLLACRDTEQPHAALRPVCATADRIELGALTPGATRELLRVHGSGRLSGAVMRRIHDSAHGNALHALELARAAVSGDAVSTGETMPGAAAFVPPRALADLVRGRLARLPASTRDVLLVVAAMSRPTLDDLGAAIGEDPTEDVHRAVVSGLLGADGERLRFVHPMFASACYRGTTTAARRAAHARLAAAVTDPEERARHLGLSTDLPDDAVATALEHAARHAQRRGGLDAAAELMLLAYRFTGDRTGATAGARARAAARYLTDAGIPHRAQLILRELLDTPGDRAEHVRNLIALSAVVYEVDGPAASQRLSNRAIEYAEDEPRLLAEAHLSFAERSHAPAEQRLDHARTALALLDGLPDADQSVVARLLREVALSHYHLGQGMSRELMDRASALEALADPLPVAWRARSCLGECLKYVDDFAGSEAILAETAALADRLGDVGSLASTLAHQAELELWLGRWDAADERAARAIELVGASDQVGRIAFALYGQVLVAAHRGDIEAARQLGARALAAAREANDDFTEALVNAALGFTELTAGVPTGAAAALQRADAFMRRDLVTVPRQYRYLVDYVEALTGIGELELAAEKHQALEGWAELAGTAWPRVMAARAGGLLLERRGDRPGALQALERATTIADELPLPFVRARTQLAYGAALRRARSKRRARCVLDAAAVTFEELGAVPWAQRARGELARISGRASSGTSLTVTEQRVAELVAQGLSNQQVATELVVTPRTVEAHLTRIYAKLGYRSRADLLRHGVGVSALPHDQPPA